MDYINSYECAPAAAALSPERNEVWNDDELTLNPNYSRRTTSISHCFDHLLSMLGHLTCSTSLFGNGPYIVQTACRRDLLWWKIEGIVVCQHWAFVYGLPLQRPFRVYKAWCRAGVTQLALHLSPPLPSFYASINSRDNTRASLQVISLHRQQIIRTAVAGRWYDRTPAVHLARVVKPLDLSLPA